jgi:hypothetical protein
MRLLKLLDITAGREYVYIYLYKYIKFLTYPIGNWNQSKSGYVLINYTTDSNSGLDLLAS